MPKLGNYITGSWITGDGEGQPLYNAYNGEIITHASTKGLDFAAILDYARQTGNPALRRMTFPERGRMLRALALHLREHLETFYPHQLPYRRHPCRQLGRPGRRDREPVLLCLTTPQIPR